MNAEPIKDVLETGRAASEKDVTPKDLLIFAKTILLVLALLFVLGAVDAMFQPNNTVFEACKTILPPIATLVIGYYFGKSSDS